MRDAGCGAPHPASRIPQGAGCGLRVAGCGSYEELLAKSDHRTFACKTVLIMCWEGLGIARAAPQAIIDHMSMRCAEHPRDL